MEGVDAFLKRVEKSTPLHRFFIDTLLKDIDSNTLSGKTQLISRTKPYLSKMPDGPAKDLLIEELVRLTRIEHHRIIQFLQENSAPNNTLKPIQQPIITRTPCHIAIALLLQHPEIYAKDMRVLANGDNHLQLLQQLMQHIQENPGITTGSLIELWRDTSWFDIVNAFAAWDHQVPTQTQSNELKEILSFINKQYHENKIQTLIEKSRNMSLTETERLELQMLLQKRHHITKK